MGCSSESCEKGGRGGSARLTTGLARTPALSPLLLPREVVVARAALVGLLVVAVPGRVVVDRRLRVTTLARLLGEAAGLDGQLRGVDRLADGQRSRRLGDQCACAVVEVEADELQRGGLTVDRPLHLELLAVPAVVLVLRHAVEAGVHVHAADELHAGRNARRVVASLALAGARVVARHLRLARCLDRGQFARDQGIALVDLRALHGLAVGADVNPRVRALFRSLVVAPRCAAIDLRRTRFSAQWCDDERAEH